MGNANRGADAERRVFRTPFAVGFNVLLTVAMIVIVVDLARRGTWTEALGFAPVLLFPVVVGYLLTVRPRVVADESGVIARNLLRDIRAPWEAIDRIDATNAVRLQIGERRYRCWAMRTSWWTQARTGGRGRARCDEVAAELREMAKRFRDRTSPEASGAEAAAPPATPAPAVVSWSWSAITILGVGLVLLLGSMSGWTP